MYDSRGANPAEGIIMQSPNIVTGKQFPVTMFPRHDIVTGKQFPNHDRGGFTWENGRTF